MFTITDLSRAIHTLVANKQYPEALDFFKLRKVEVEIQQISQNEFLVANMLTALRGIKAFDAAHQFLNIYQLKIDEHTPIRVLNSYGWLLYFEYKTKPAELHIESNDKRLLALMVLLKNTNDEYSTNLAEYIFKLVMQTQKTQAAPNWKYVAQICEHTDPAKLSTSCASIQVEQRGQQKEMELASPREEWYAMYSKALYEGGEYEQCTNICHQALQIFDKMHYTNEIWFERRKAQCLTKTNKFEEAITIYQKLIPKKSDWFILKELCECYFKVGEYGKSLNYARKAAKAYGPINFKVELIELLGDILQQQNEIGLANKHYRLAKFIREAEKWRIDKALADKIACTLSANYQAADNNADTKETLKAELIPFWSIDDHKPTKQILLTKTDQKAGEKQFGTITKLLAAKPAGIDGFVKSDSGESVYFFVPSSVAVYNQLKVGIRIEYQLQPATKGVKAVKIKLL